MTTVTSSRGTMAMPGMGDAKQFTMQVIGAPTTAATGADLKFRITDPATGAPVTDYDVVHEKQLHLFAVRDTGAAPGGRFTDFQHVHPTYDGDGVWELPGFTATNGGTTRLFGDFATKGTGGNAQAALTISGPASTPAPDLSGGYSAHLVHSMKMGKAVHAVVEVDDPKGAPVAAVDPFLGAPAHWALFGASSAASDVALAHAHPMDELTDGQLQFHVMAKPGDAYQGWLQFQPKGGQLVTVPLSLSQAADAAARTT